MLTMDLNAEDGSALATLKMLEQRLRRLEFLLHGSSDAIGVPDPASAPATRDDTASTRLADVESKLRRLASRHNLVRDILDLRMESGLATYAMY